MVDDHSLSLGTTIKYNPHLWSDSQLQSIFVVRTKELTNILNRLRTAAPDKPPQHLLITGHRGMGKSTLLRRVALAVQEDSELNQRWLALSFSEEQYTVATLAELWLNVLDAMIDAQEKAGASAAELRKMEAEAHRISTLSTQDQENKALELLHTWKDQCKRRLLLLIDSTDGLFAGLSASISKTSGADTPLWRLRNTLSHDPDIFWLGASYQALESTGGYSDSFHDFFDIIELQVLSVEEMRQAMLALAQNLGVGGYPPGEKSAEEMSRRLDAHPGRLKALRTFTGGNPRTTVILYDLIASEGEGAGILADLKSLLDSMTNLYLPRMSILAEQPRKLFAHTMEHWYPISAADLAKVSGIAVTTVSGQLNRLERDGLVEKVPLEGGRRRSGYQVAERLFNIWYLMRYPSRRVRKGLTWLVEFLRHWYLLEELQTKATCRLDGLAHGLFSDNDQMKYSLALAQALPCDCRERNQLEMSIYSAISRLDCQTRDALANIAPDLLDLEGEDRVFKDTHDYLQRFARLDDLLGLCPHVPPEQMPLWIEMVKGSISLSLDKKERVAQTCEVLSSGQVQQLMEVLQKEQEGRRDRLGEKEKIIREKVAHGEFFPYCPDAELMYKQIMACFGDDATLMIFCASQMERFHQDQWLEKIYRKAMELDPKNTSPWIGLGNLLQDHLGRYDEAEAAYRKAMELDQKNAGPWNNLGNLLQVHLGRYDEAEAAYRKAMALDKKNAGLWSNLGNLLQDHLDRYDEAEAAYRRAMELDPKNARPWIGLGNLLQVHLGRYDEAEAAYHKAMELDPKNASPWIGLGNLLQVHLGRYEEAEAAYRRATELDPKNANPWIGLGNLLQDHPGRYEEAEAAYRKAMELDPKNASPWNGLGNLLHDHLGRYDEAGDAYRRAMELDPADPFPVANLARLFVRQDQNESASEAFRKVISFIGAPKGIAYHGLLLQAHLWLHNQDAAIQSLDALAQAASNDDVHAMFRLREQARECSTIGLAGRLGALMEMSALADFLRPFSLALKAVSGDPDALTGIPPELKTVAEEVLASLPKQQGFSSTLSHCFAVASGTL